MADFLKEDGSRQGAINLDYVGEMTAAIEAQKTRRLEVQGSEHQLQGIAVFHGEPGLE